MTKSLVGLVLVMVVGLLGGCATAWNAPPPSDSSTSRRSGIAGRVDSGGVIAGTGGGMPARSGMGRAGK